MLNKIVFLLQRFFWNPEKHARKRGVSIGKNCYISTRYFGSEPYLIEIGDDVQVTSDVKFFTHGGGWVFRHKYPKLDTFGKIKIGNNVYIGNGSIILPGVTIEDNVIVGAGSVVTKSINSGLVVGGNPAKVICEIDELEEKMIKCNVNTKGMSAKEKKKLLLNLNENLFLKKRFL